MDWPTPGIYRITNNVTGLYLDLSGSQPTGNVINWPLNNPPTGNQQWNVSYLNPTVGSGGGYILTAVSPISHIWGTDNLGSPLKGDPTLQKYFYISPVIDLSHQYTITTQNRDCSCAGMAWSGHAQGAAVTLELANATDPTQYWSLARLS